MPVEPWESELRPLLSQVDPGCLPQHVAVIMDGNGRWANARHQPRIFGHREGVKTAKRIVKAAKIIGLRYITLYAFSRENWSRPPAEVSALMGLLEQFLRDEIDELDDNNVRLNAIGRIEELPPAVVAILKLSIDRLAKNTGPVLNLALNYGGKTEIIDACQKILAEHDGTRPCRVTEESFKQYLYTAGQPDVDLLIRTSGEYRISNFLLYQSAYAELWITETLWPDFSPAELIRAIGDFQKRTRRFGGV